MKFCTSPPPLPVKSKHTFPLRLLLHATALRSPASSLGHRPELLISKQEASQPKRRRPGPAAQPRAGAGAPACRSCPEEPGSAAPPAPQPAHLQLSKGKLHLMRYSAAEGFFFFLSLSCASLSIPQTEMHE